MVSAQTLLDRMEESVNRTHAEVTRVRWISRVRLAITGVGLLFGAAAIEGSIPLGWVALPIAVFLTMVLLHERLLMRAIRGQRIGEFHGRALRRVKADASGGGERPRSPSDMLREQGSRTTPELAEAELLVRRADRLRRLGGGRAVEHRLDEHLDLFGAGELFERLADWRTDAGGETLASWMLRPVPHDESRERQQAIQELAPRLDLREAVAATGSQDRWPSQRGTLSRWAGEHAAGYGEERAWRALGGEDPAEDREPPPWLPSRQWARLAAVAAGTLAVANLLGLSLLLSGLAGVTPLLFSLSASVVAGLASRRLVREADAALGALVDEGEGLRQVVAILRGEAFEATALKRLREQVEDADLPLRRLQRIRSCFVVRRNLMFAPLAVLVFWGTGFALAQVRWRRRHEADLARWTAAAGAFDALLGLAQYAEERPGDEYAEYDEKPGFAAAELGHPLIAQDRLARNSITLGRGDADFLIVTGSNMSGKSTLLRAIGTNYVLARLGAPVTANRFQLGRLALGPSISSHDSLRDGVSRFLAELLALRAVLDAGAADVPLLCLLDEVLEGTNSSDRKIAVRALLEELGRQDAVGILTTHDLSLTELATELPGRIRNMHFTEEIKDGAMRFDFRLRDGVLPKGNALELMRILNLPVPGGDGAEYTALPELVSGQEN